MNMRPYNKLTLLNRERQVWTPNELWHLGAFIFQEHDRSACTLENGPTIFQLGANWEYEDRVNLSLSRLLRSLGIMPNTNARSTNM
jgi:hypothetical protein